MSAGQPPAEQAAIRAAPPLAILGALAALADLAVNRVAVRAGAELLDPGPVLQWMRLGALPRNLAAVCGLFAMLGALVHYLRMPGFASLWVRLPVAAFSGIVMPTLVLATFLPRERMAPLFVFFAMFAIDVLVITFAAVALGYRGLWLRLGAFAALATALQAMIVVTIAAIRAQLISGIGGPVAWIARHGGELSWFAVPVLLAPALAVRAQDRRDRAAAGLGAIVALGVLALGIAGERTLHPHYSTVVYGAFRVAALPEAASILYAIPVAIGLGAGSWGIASADPWRRQLGAGIVFWIAGGYAGRSPIQLLDALVAIMLIARAAQAADPEGVRRALLRWTAAEPEPEPARSTARASGSDPPETIEADERA